LASRSESKSNERARPCCRRRIAYGRYERPFHGIECPTTLEKRAATYTGFASPGCAAPSGFLGLLTLSSPRYPAGPVSYRRRSWGSPFRGFPFRIAGDTSSAPPAPLDVVVDGRAWRLSEPAPVPRRRVSPIVAPRSGVGVTRESVVGFGRAFRGLSPFRKSVLRSAGVSRRWEPILSWVSALQGVPPRRLDTTAAVSPLLRFPDRVPKQAAAGAPGSSKQRGWLVSLETAAPRELSVLVPAADD
jgi:hypothetical protein